MVATVDLGGRRVSRIGLSTAALRVTGMWGEPVERTSAISIIRRATEMGADLIEVAAPFGPWADLVREADPKGATVCLRLTGAVRGRTPEDAVAAIEAARHRLGPSVRAGLVVVEPALLDAAREGCPGPVGAVVDGRTSMSGLGDVAAVRGPYPAPDHALEWCEDRQIPYMCNNARVLTAGERTVALLEPSSLSEVERLFTEVSGAGAPTPPGATPG